MDFHGFEVDFFEGVRLWELRRQKLEVKEIFTPKLTRCQDMQTICG
jgi:hypothetical protein